MKRKMLSIVCVFVLILSMTVTAAAESPEPIVIDTTHSGITVTTSDPGAQVNEGQVPAAPISEPTGIGFLPFDIRYDNHNGVPVIVKSFRVPVGVNPSALVRADFEDAGYLYSMQHILAVDTIFRTEQKMVSQTVTITTDDDDSDTLTRYFTPVIEFREEGFVGQLELDRASMQTEPVGLESYSFPVQRTVPIPGLIRNDVYSIPRTHGGLRLQDVRWVMTDSVPRGDTLFPTRFTALAIYGGMARGERAEEFITTAMYRGMVSRTVESENVFSIIYHGTRIAVEVEVEDVAEGTGFAFTGSHAIVGLIALAIGAGAIALIFKGPALALAARSGRGKGRQGDVPVNLD